jgi:hypothetical protein
MIYKGLLRQATMMAFNDAFFVVYIIMVCVLPFVFFMKMGKQGLPPGMH